MNESQERITDIKIIAKELKDKLAELNDDYGLKQIMFGYTTECGYIKNITVDV